MSRPIVYACAALAVGVLACSSGLTGPQRDAADAYADFAEQNGIELDRGCIDDVLADLPDADAQTIAAAPDIFAAVELSDEGTDIVSQIAPKCTEFESYRDYVIDVTSLSGRSDRDCVREGLASTSTVEEVNQVVVEVAISCRQDG